LCIVFNSVASINNKNYKPWLVVFCYHHTSYRASSAVAAVRADCSNDDITIATRR